MPHSLETSSTNTTPGVGPPADTEDEVQVIHDEPFFSIARRRGEFVGMIQNHAVKFSAVQTTTAQYGLLVEEITSNGGGEFFLHLREVTE